MVLTPPYPMIQGRRDYRIDLLRGLVMVLLIIIHMDFYSLFSLVAWERFGGTSTAEGFVALSGMVVGMVYGAKFDSEGFVSISQRLLKRAFQLYRVNLFVILSIPLFNWIPNIHAFNLMHWVVPGTTRAYPVYHLKSGNFLDLLKDALILNAGPHQFQVIGLYVVLLIGAPIALYLIKTGKTAWLLMISWALYIYYGQTQVKITGIRYETAFPTLAWQLLFYNAMVIGAHRQKISLFFIPHRKHIFVSLCAVGSIIFFIFIWNKPQAIFWPWPGLSLIQASQFYSLYDQWFQKNPLGFGRVINNVCLFVIAYTLLTRYWDIICARLGGFLIPIGQASLYVFFVHIYIILLVDNTYLLTYNNFWINTLIHGGSLLLIWLMVKNKVLFHWIPK